MFKLENLLGNEYFPAELPKCFSSKDVIPFCSQLEGWSSSVNPKNSYPLVYSGFKNESARRKFAVPNFYHYFKAAKCIVDNSGDILSITSRGKKSLTAPRKGNVEYDKAYKKLSYSRSETRAIVEMMYQNNIYQVKLDISSFFESIYTHSIAWAMHTKKRAKVSHGSLVGDKIDKHVREMNSSQTNGVLVGNAISRIVSEIILCTVDKEIEGKFPNLQYVRFVDDYYIFLKKPDEVDKVITFIRNSLAEYELLLNENKIKIMQSPFNYDNLWITELRLFLHMNSEMLLDKATVLYEQYHDIAIFKYVLKAIEVQQVKKKDWDRLESRLYNLWIRFPSLSELILNLLLQKKKDIHRQKLIAAFYTNMERCRELNWQLELIWLIWIAKVLEINIKQDEVVKIFDSGNDLAIIILLDCIKQGTIKKTKRISTAIDDLRDELENLDGTSKELMWTNRWLLAYECELNGWLNTATKSFNRVSGNPFYNQLLKKKVRFYHSAYSPVVNASKRLKSGIGKREVKNYMELVKKATESHRDYALIKEEVDKINAEFADLLDEELY